MLTDTGRNQYVACKINMAHEKPILFINFFVGT